MRSAVRRHPPRCPTRGPCRRRRGPHTARVFRSSHNEPLGNCARTMSSRVVLRGRVGGVHEVRHDPPRRGGAIIAPAAVEATNVPAGARARVARPPVRCALARVVGGEGRTRAGAGWPVALRPARECVKCESPKGGTRGGGGSGSAASTASPAGSQSSAATRMHVTEAKRRRTSEGREKARENDEGPQANRWGGVPQGRWRRPSNVVTGKCRAPLGVRAGHAPRTALGTGGMFRGKAREPAAPIPRWARRD